MSKPFTPREAIESNMTMLPDFVFDAFNKIIASNYSHSSKQVSFKQDEVIHLMIEMIKENPEALPNNIKEKMLSTAKVNFITEAIKHTSLKNLIFEEGWLNIEPMYEKSGWKVSYDKPGYNESYPSTFTFIAV